MKLFDLRHNFLLLQKRIWQAYTLYSLTLGRWRKPETKPYHRLRIQQYTGMFILTNYFSLLYLDEYLWEYLVAEEVTPYSTPNILLLHNASNRWITAIKNAIIHPTPYAYVSCFAVMWKNLVFRILRENYDLTACLDVRVEGNNSDGNVRGKNTRKILYEITY